MTAVQKLLDAIPKLLEQRKFRSVNSKGKNKIFSNFQITGATTKWKSKTETDFVYSYETRLAGKKKEVEDFIKGFTSEEMEILKELLGEDKGDHIADTKSLMSRLITFKNYTVTSKLENSPKQLYDYEVQQNKSQKLKKDDVNEPTIAQYYEAYLLHKQTQKKIQNGNVETNKGPSILRMKEIGDLYKSLGKDDIMNIYGYSDVGGKAIIMKVQDEYIQDGKKLHKVPNYKLATSKKKDVEYALKDLISLGSIGLKKNQISGVVKAWMDNKKDVASGGGRGGKVEKGPQKIRISPTTNSNKRPPQTTRTKITVKK